MKINQMIREKRKALSLTQEQVAEYLGVSTPAVNKWEKGSTYPDITLLPALARLLKTDLNTLLSFHEDLSKIEIEDFVNGLDEIVQRQNYAEAFQKALDKIQEYPTCDELIYSTVIYLEGALTLYNVPDPEKYQTVFAAFYEQLADSDLQEIRDVATSMLISYARNNDDFAKAETLISTLPFSSIDKEEQLAILYRCQKKYEDAQKIWEHRVLKGVTDIQTALINMIEWALVEKHNQDAEYFADLYERITRQFYLPEWMGYNAHLQIAIEQQDKDNVLAILEKMLPAMKQEWNPHNCPLYRNLNGADDMTFLSGKVADSICQELSIKAEYAFLREGTDWAELLRRIGNDIGENDS